MALYFYLVPFSHKLHTMFYPIINLTLLYNHNDLRITVKWIVFSIGAPIIVGSINVISPLTICCSENTETLQCQTPVSFKTVWVRFNLTTSGPFSRWYLLLFMIVLPSGDVQVMVAWGLLSRSVPQMRDRLSPSCT